MCLDALAGALDGAPAAAPPDGPTPEWQVHYEAPIARGLLADAGIPAPRG